MAFGSFDNKSSNAPFSEINTTPLVDVMLVLLIIFIVTAPLLTHTTKVNLPVAGENIEEQKPDIITLSLNEKDELFWNDVKISSEDLFSRLEEAGKKSSQPELHLRADRNTRYQKIAEIMASAQKAGIQKLGFVSQPKK